MTFAYFYVVHDKIVALASSCIVEKSDSDGSLSRRHRESETVVLPRGLPLCYSAYESGGVITQSISGHVEYLESQIGIVGIPSLRSQEHQIDYPRREIVLCTGGQPRHDSLVELFGIHHGVNHKHVAARHVVRIGMVAEIRMPYFAAAAAHVVGIGFHQPIVIGTRSAYNE